jgi:hypothetical protein
VGTENEITGLTQRFCMVMFQSVMECVEPLGSRKFKRTVVCLVNIQHLVSLFGARGSIVG